MPNSSHSDDDYKLWVLLLRVRDAGFKARKKELAQFSISPIKSAVLFAIKDAGHKATPGEIAKRIFRAPHSVSEVLIRMEREGLIKKDRVAGEGNRVTVTLTKKGQQAYRMSAKRDAVHRMLSTLSTGQRRQLESCLMTLWNSALKELESKPADFFPFD
jgi:DNA-binding MarR family transcriptional regulator